MKRDSDSFVKSFENVDDIREQYLLLIVHGLEQSKSARISILLILKSQSTKFKAATL
jgi:hypothetical protein